MPWDKPFNVRGLWQKRDLGTATNDFASMIGPHDVVLLRLRAYPRTVSR